MARPDPQKIYMMPAVVGYEPTGDGAEGTWYRDVLSLSVTYLTHKEALERLFPDCFEVGVDPDHEPLVTVSWSRNRQIDWLAGGSYNIVGVNAAATFRGKEETVAGGYCLILWEDRTEPILTGREYTGIPKVYADITDLLPSENGFKVRASQLGHPIVEIEIGDLREVPAEQLKAMEEGARQGNWMGYKYIPKISGPGADVEYATLFPSEGVYESAHSGTGRVRFFPSTFQDNPTQFQVVNLLGELEPLEVRSALMVQGKNRLLSGRARALR